MDAPTIGILDLKEFSFHQIKTKNYDLGTNTILFFLSFIFRVFGLEFGWKNLAFDRKESFLG